MVDSDEWRRTYRELNELPCRFEKTILAGFARCGHAGRFCLAEREGVRCGATDAHARCAAFLDRVREASRFALKAPQTGARPAHAGALRMQLGGLRGLSGLCGGAPDAPIDDIAGLIGDALATHGGFERLPLEPIVRAIAACRERRPR